LTSFEGQIKINKLTLNRDDDDNDDDGYSLSAVSLSFLTARTRDKVKGRLFWGKKTSTIKAKN
jgi:hypothetical protein